MRRLLALSLTLAALFTIAACDSDAPTAPTLPDGPVTLNSLFKSQFSDIEMFERTEIRDQDSFDAAWIRALGSDPAPPPKPPVDFGQDMVLLVASGAEDNDCFSIAITSAAADGTDLTVTVTETGPDADCSCANIIVQPVELVQVPRADRVDFDNINAFACAS